MWVADMDFPAPPAVIAALHERVDHGIFGYTHAPRDLEDTVVSMLEAEYGWKIERDSIVWLPGLVTGINVACRTCEGDILTATPIYPPFLSSPIHSGRRVKRAPMSLESGRWVNDFTAIEEAAKDCGLFLLCNPHNPTGRIF
ncbi:MAG: aminotransferase class I/II-fold pyridoxal phosphate-dependent enzyme, partial [Burkholderiales bacterium]|nr:aminotransferase class I/II-fold pyridoxal phosphate-dependent enzyme [Burkholderiales bacterium]